MRRRLSLSTTDIDWLNMDTFDHFVRSDVAHDPELRAILTDCGCGHLFDLAKPGARVALLEGAAENTRKYLELPLPDV